MAHLLLEFTDGRKMQRILGVLLALCTLGHHPQVGQAGGRDINQAQVSNYRLVPTNVVVAKPQTLLLILDQHFNGPTLKVSGQYFFSRRMNVVRHQCDMVGLPFPSREDNLNLSQTIHSADPFGQTIRTTFAQSLDRVRFAFSFQYIAAVFATDRSVNTSFSKVKIP